MFCFILHVYHNVNMQNIARGGIKQRLYNGVIRITPSGVGFVSVESFKEEIEINPVFLGTAFHKDTVRVALQKSQKRETLSGKVVDVVARWKEKFVGTIKKEDGVYVLIPDDERMYVDIVIPKQLLAGGTPGDKAVCRITNWIDQNKNPEGEVIEVLGVAGDNDVEIRSIAIERKIDISFPADIIEDAESISGTISEKEIKRRVDFRKIPTFTIDPDNAKDFDDALSVRVTKDKEGYEVGIHIADVTHYVKDGTALDVEAAKRGTSVYLVDRTIPMLPETLSNDLCSLNPNEDKLAFSAVFTLDKKAKVVKQWFGRTVIQSDKRFTYEEAQSVLNRCKGPHAKELSVLDKLSEMIRRKREKDGTITFRDQEVRFVLDESGVPSDIIIKKRIRTHFLIEDFMLLANKRVAEMVSNIIRTYRSGKPFVYRVHDAPNPEKITRLISLLRTLGYTIKTRGPDVSQEDITKMLAESQGKNEEALVQQAAISAMSKAFYSTKNIGHFGLAFPYYAHFTSPIRRYPDIMVHRLLDKYLRKIPIEAKEVDNYEQLSAYASQMERRAEEASRDSIKYKQVQYMERRIGKKIVGVISGVTKWGLYVQDTKTMGEGLVPMRDLKDDYYLFDDKTLSIVGKRTKKRFRLGDTIEVTVGAVDVKKRRINYSLV